MGVQLAGQVFATQVLLHVCAAMLPQHLAETWLVAQPQDRLRQLVWIGGVESDGRPGVFDCEGIGVSSGSKEDWASAGHRLEHLDGNGGLEKR